MFPPKKINRIYGYRSKRSTRNQDTWQVANRFSSWTMVVLGCMNMNAGWTCFLLLEPDMAMLCTVGILVLQLLFMVFLTERRLKYLFDKEGNRYTIIEE